MVNLINRLPAERFRHAVIALTEVTEFRRRIERDDVQFLALHKPPGQGLAVPADGTRACASSDRRRAHAKPRGARDVGACGWAGVPVRIHGEHGMTNDPDGAQPEVSSRAPCYRPSCTTTSRCRASSALPHRSRRRHGDASSRSTTASTPALLPAPGARARSRAALHGAATVAGGHGGPAARGQGPGLLAHARSFARSRAAPEAQGALRLVMVGEDRCGRTSSAYSTKRALRDLAWLAGERARRAGRSCAVSTVRAALARRRHLEHHPGGDGHRPCRSSPRASAETANLLEDARHRSLVPPGRVDAWRRRYSTTFAIPAARERGRRARAGSSAISASTRMVARLRRSVSEPLSRPTPAASITAFGS